MNSKLGINLVIVIFLLYWEKAKVRSLIKQTPEPIQGFSQKRISPVTLVRAIGFHDTSESRVLWYSLRIAS